MFHDITKRTKSIEVCYQQNHYICSIKGTPMKTKPLVH